MEQFATLIAKKEVGLKVPGARGKATHVKIGDRFCVTSPKYMNVKQGAALIMREKNARLNQGLLLTNEQINELFEVA